MKSWHEFKLLKEERERNDVIETIISFRNFYIKANDVERVTAINVIYRNFVNNRISGNRAFSQLLNVSKNGKPESLDDYHAKMDPVSREERPKWNSQKPISVIRKPKFAGVNPQDLSGLYTRVGNEFVRK